MQSALNASPRVRALGETMTRLSGRGAPPAANAPPVQRKITMAGGKVASCAIGLTNLHETPLLATDAAKAVIGSSLDAASLKQAAAAAA